jgi:hypothetical protein
VLVADADHTLTHHTYRIYLAAHRLVAADVAAIKVIFCCGIYDPTGKSLSCTSVVSGAILRYIHIHNPQISAPFDLPVGGAFSCRRSGAVEGEVWATNQGDHEPM